MERILTPFEEGKVLLVNKPLTWTSFQVVNKIKHLLKRQYGLKKIKVGHAGTLDPLATGLLIVCTGKKTKTIPEIQNQEKEYTGAFFVGATTPSYDLETEPDVLYPVGHITEDQIREVARNFIGEHQQIPPLYSAKKIEGERAYDIARRGEQREMKASVIVVKEFEIINIGMPVISFRVVCSKGTYIRSLAHDFGKALGSGAYLKALCRTRIGDYRLEEAKTLDQVEAEIRLA